MLIIDKIKQYVDSKGIAVSVFEKSIGASEGLLRNAFKSKREINAKWIGKISEVYPDLNMNWLFSDEGSMMKSNYIQEEHINTINESKTLEYKMPSQSVNLYDAMVTGGVVDLFKDQQNNIPIGKIVIPNMPKCDGAVTITGDGMYPLVKSGDIVFYKTINNLPNSILYGNMYIVVLDIEGDELVMIKYVQRGKDDNHVLLVSENKYHAPKEIHIQYITAIALVKGNVRFNFHT